MLASDMLGCYWLLILPSMHPNALRSVDSINGTGPHIPSAIIFLIPPPGNEQERLNTFQLIGFVTSVQQRL